MRIASHWMLPADTESPIYGGLGTWANKTFQSIMHSFRCHHHNNNKSLNWFHGFKIKSVLWCHSIARINDTKKKVKSGCFVALFVFFANFITTFGILCNFTFKLFVGFVTPSPSLWMLNLPSQWQSGGAYSLILFVQSGTFFLPKTEL